MNKTRVQPDIHGTETGNRHRQMCLIVSYLMQVIHIPDGNHLIQAFSSGHESTNREALVHWVEKHLDEIDPDDAECRLRKLAGQTNKRAGD